MQINYLNIPKVIHLYIMNDFLDTNTLAKMRLINKKIGAQATLILLKKISNGEVTFSNSYLSKLVNQKIDRALRFDGINYTLSCQYNTGNQEIAMKSWSGQTGTKLNINHKFKNVDLSFSIFYGDNCTNFIIKKSGFMCPKDKNKKQKCVIF